MSSPAETEQTFLIGSQWNSLYRDRYSYERATLLAESLRAWRLNPLARQITRLYKIYNLDGINYQCSHPATKKFLDEFWNHDLNRMKKQLEKISNEMFLTGNLFTAYSVDAVGMTYLRIYPTDQIDQIITAENDVEQEIGYITIPVNSEVEAKTFVNPRGRPTSETPVFMRHDAINLLAGCVWGEGEIWPDLPWLGRYATFLEDRVRLNHFRQAYVYDVTIEGKTTDEIKVIKNNIQMNPPQPGSVNVHGKEEIWQIMSPKLESASAEHDGLQIKKMVAVNHAPMHYLAEPESATRTTADAAGTPVFKAYENQQENFLDILHDILTIVVQRRAAKDNSVDATAKIEVTAADATERDNAALALAASQIVQSIGELYDRELIESDEYLRLAYRFAGEVLPENFKAPKGKRKPLDKSRPQNEGGIKVDAETGETTEQK
jgi:hypothetical protein